MRPESATNYLSEPYRASNNSERVKQENKNQHSIQWLSTKMHKGNNTITNKTKYNQFTAAPFNVTWPSFCFINLIKLWC